MCCSHHRLLLIVDFQPALLISLNQLALWPGLTEREFL
jgi:hypothetical protein